VNKPDQYRLPRGVVPRHYELVLEPDLDQARFAGSVRIHVDVVEASTEILLNALDLDIAAARVVGARGPIDAQVHSDASAERITLTLADRLEIGQATLEIQFSGVLNDKLLGFYRSSYEAADGTTKILATTQFESTNARRAFPCFDEPDFKAVFEVTLVVAQGLEAISCGPEVESQILGDGRRRVRFAPTMIMSTYLVAFIVGELEYSETVDAGGTDLRIVHVPGKGHLTGFALETGAAALKWLADYYAIAYPGEKLDMIAIPDFAFGAMENLGCVTYRETLLLVDPTTTPAAELSRIADVISHELAHMWFGDLVTMKWWNGIWLKEAFATFMEMAAVDAMHPEWRRWDQFGQSRSAAFAVDSLASTRAIEFEVRSPAEAEGMYDILTYEKGAAVLRMLEQYLGPAAFREAVHLYLERYAYGNTENEDLWTAIEESTGEPVKATAESWIFQGGFPLVSVNRVSPTQITCTQTRFLLAGSQSDDRLWHIPIILRAKVDGEIIEHRLLLSSQSEQITFDGQVEWVVANAGGDGFYRVSYDDGLRESLVGEVQEILTSLERHNLVDDTWAAVHAGHAPAIAFLRLVEGFASETDVGVWKAIAQGLGTLNRVLDSADRSRFQVRVSDLSTAALEVIGTEPAEAEDSLTRETRAVLLGLAANVGENPAAIEWAKRVHNTAILDPAGVDPNLASTALRVVAAHGTADDYQSVLTTFSSAATPQEEVRYLYALADFPTEKQMNDTLAMTLTDQVRTQNAPFLVSRCLTNREHGAVAWEFITHNWDEIIERYPSNSIVRMLEGVKALSRPDDASAVGAFFETHEVAQGKLTLAQHLETLRINVALRKRESTALASEL
jgi:aminopeptidase N